MLKIEELNDPASSLCKAAPDEPIFVLRAQDKLAPKTVRDWASRLMLEADNTSDPELRVRQSAKAVEATKLADRMEAWQAANTSKVPD